MMEPNDFHIDANVTCHQARDGAAILYLIHSLVNFLPKGGILSIQPHFVTTRCKL